MKFTDESSISPRRILVYGPSGSGKSQLVGQLASVRKLLWFSLDNGHSVLRKMPREWQENIELVKLPDTKSFPIAIETSLKVIKGGLCKICDTHGKVSCQICAKESKTYTSIELNQLGSDTVVVFDHLTRLTSSAIAHITKGKEDDYKMQTDDWGSLSKLLDVFLSHVQQSPYHIVCISHETDSEKDERAPERLVPTAGSRNTSKNSASFFDEVIRAEVKNKKHTFVSSSTAAMNFMAKSRSDFKIEDMAVPSLLPLFAHPIDVPLIKMPTMAEITAAHEISEAENVLETHGMAVVQTPKVVITQISEASSALQRIKDKIAAGRAK